MENIICIDVGGTSIKFGLFDIKGNCLNSGEVATKAHEIGGRGIMNKIEEICEKYFSENKISGITISTSGMVDFENGKILFSDARQIPGYTGIEIKKELEEKFKVRCEVENDVNAAGLGESWLGSGGEYDKVVMLTVGTGIGGCLIDDGKLLHGACMCAGEVGKMIVDGKTFEAQASTTALVRKVAEAKNIDVSGLNGKMIFEQIEAKDEICIQKMDEMINYLAIGIANICYVFNPEVVILGGGIMAREDFFRPRLQQKLGEYLNELIYPNTHLEFAKLKNNAGMIGALKNFLDRK